MRVITEATVDNPDSVPLFFDVVIDENNWIIGEHLIFVYQTYPKERSRYSYPFVVDSEGEVDFGMEEPKGNTNLRDKTIVPGSIILWAGPGWDETFRIKELVALADWRRFQLSTEQPNQFTFSFPLLPFAPTGYFTPETCPR